MRVSPATLKQSAIPAVPTPEFQDRHPGRLAFFPELKACAYNAIACPLRLARAPPRSWPPPVGGRDFKGRQSQPSFTDDMGKLLGCTFRLPLKGVPSSLGNDQFPAARCVFSDV